MRFTLFATTPLYNLLIVQALLFNVLNSASGIHYDLNTKAGQDQYKDVQLAQLILSNVFFAATCAAMLVLGFSRHAWLEWQTKQASGSDREFFSIIHGFSTLTARV